MAEAKKQNFFVRAIKSTKRWWREMISELKKVVWPSLPQVINNSLIVLAMIFVVAVFIGIFDFGATEAVKFLIRSFG